MIPGEIHTGSTPLEMNSGRERRSLVVVNAGDRPIQIGSHLHFPDANPALHFDREEARGFRLDVPSGTSVRMEPGVSRTVDLVALGGRRQVPGLQLRDRTLPEHVAGREPRRVVPFGTPNTNVEKPGHASESRIQISDQTAADDGPSEQEPS